MASSAKPNLLSDLVTQVTLQQQKRSNLINKLRNLEEECEKLDDASKVSDSKTLESKAEIKSFKVKTPKQSTKILALSAQLSEQQTSRSSLLLTLSSMQEKTKLMEEERAAKVTEYETLIERANDKMMKARADYANAGNYISLFKISHKLYIL